MKKAAIMNRFFVVFCLFIFIGQAACRKNNRDLYGNWSVSYFHPYSYFECRIWEFKRFGKMVEYSSSNQCLIKDLELKTWKYKYVKDILTISSDDKPVSFRHVEDKDNSMIFQGVEYEDVMIKLTKI